MRKKASVDRSGAEGASEVHTHRSKRRVVGEGGSQTVGGRLDIGLNRRGHVARRLSGTCSVLEERSKALMDADKIQAVVDT